MNSFNFFSRLLILPVLLIPASCNILKPVKDTSVSHLLDPVIPDRRITGSKPGIAIPRPSLPTYLDRNELVTRTHTGELRMNSWHVWAEPLDSSISRVTAVNLGRLVNSLNVQPVENFITVDYEWLLEIRVSRFETDANGDFVFACTWKLQPVTGKTAPVRDFTIRIPMTQANPAAAGPQTERVNAMNEALAALARKIAESF